MVVRFQDRTQAGRNLAISLESYRGPATLALGLPRGGVVVAAEIAEVLDCALDVIITRKIGAPGNPEFAIGAISEGGGTVLNEREINRFGIGQEYLANEIRKEGEEIKRRIQLYRKGTPLPEMQNRPVLVIDDGVATGYTMLAALRAVRQMGAKPVVMATPVIPPNTLDRLSFECDDSVVLAAPEPFYAVGMFYEDFEQVSDDEVTRLLHQAHQREQQQAQRRRAA